MAWYEDWFNSDAYDLVYRNRDESEAEELVDLVISTVALEAGSRVLDVGCGRGRHAMSFARRGHRVTGLDLSERALSIARDRAEAEQLDISFVRGDMREPVAENAFDLVVNLFTAFGYFTDPNDHLRAVQALKTAARPGAWVVQDFMNAPVVRATFIPEDERTIGDVHVHQKRRLRDGRIEKTITLSLDGDVHTFEESVELLDMAAFESLYSRAGLTVRHVFGDYDGSAYTAASPRLILVSSA